MSPVMNAIAGGRAGSRAGTAVASAAAGGAAVAAGGGCAGTAVVVGRAAVPPQAATRTARAMLQRWRVMKRSVGRRRRGVGREFRGRLEQEAEDVVRLFRRHDGVDEAPRT